MSNSNPADWKRQTQKSTKFDVPEGLKSQTIAGLSMDLTQMQKRLAAGLPVSTTSRTIETKFRNMDLTDIAQLENELARKRSKIQEAAAQYKADQDATSKAQRLQELEQLLTEKQAQQNG